MFMKILIVVLLDGIKEPSMFTLIPSNIETLNDTVLGQSIDVNMNLYI